jgi:hypothetical protein
MIELLGLIFGGLFRLLPEAGRLWEANRQRDHEREMLKLQMQADQLRAQLAMQAMEKQAEVQAQLAELQAMIAALQSQGKGFKKTGITFIDWLLGIAEFLSVMVRPVLTYWYCVCGYGAYKIASYFMILSAGSSWQNAITLLWTPQDHAVMLSIIGFWFVDRALRHQQQR